MPLSSRGLGRRVLNPKTGVRVPIAACLNYYGQAGNQ